MAFLHGKASRIILAQYDLSPYLKGINVPISCSMHDSTVFGKNAQTFLAGLKNATATCEGLLDGTGAANTGAIDDVFQASFAVIDKVLTVGEGGSGVGAIAKLMNANHAKYQINDPIKDLLHITAEFQADNGLDSGVSLHDLVAETVTGQSVSVDNLAASTNGGVGHLHVTTVTGTTPSATIKVQHSTDNTVWADLITFTAATVATSQRVELAAGTTVNRYVRAQFTISGTTPSFTFVVAFARR